LNYNFSIRKKGERYVNGLGGVSVEVPSSMIRQSEKYSLDCLRRPRFEVTNAGKFRFSPGMRLGRGVKRSQRQA